MLLSSLLFGEGLDVQVDHDGGLPQQWVVGFVGESCFMRSLRQRSHFRIRAFFPDDHESFPGNNRGGVLDFEIVMEPAPVCSLLQCGEPACAVPEFDDLLTLALPDPAHRRCGLLDRFRGAEDHHAADGVVVEGNYGHQPDLGEEPE